MSDLVALPEFIPGLGTLYVQPATLPAGPFLAYDRDGRLVSTIYMIPLADIRGAEEIRWPRGRRRERRRRRHVLQRRASGRRAAALSRRAVACAESDAKLQQRATRRVALRAGGLFFAGLAAPALVRPTRAGDVVEIRLRSDPLGTKVWFDPIGVLIEPGQTVRWVNEANVHTSTAYHPANERPCAPDPGKRRAVGLRLPGRAWRSVRDHAHGPGRLRLLLRAPRDGRDGRPDHRRPACRPRNSAVRLFPRRSGDADWRAVPAAAQAAFPAIEAIMSERVVRVATGHMHSSEPSLQPLRTHTARCSAHYPAGDAHPAPLGRLPAIGPLRDPLARDFGAPVVWQGTVAPVQLNRNLCLAGQVGSISTPYSSPLRRARNQWPRDAYARRSNRRASPLRASDQCCANSVIGTGIPNSQPCASDTPRCWTVAPLLVRFHAFRHRDNAQRGREIRQRIEDRSGGLARPDRVNERPVDLEKLELQLGEMTETRVAGAKIVEREPEAGAAQTRHRLPHGTRRHCRRRRAR